MITVTATVTDLSGSSASATASATIATPFVLGDTKPDATNTGPSLPTTSVIAGTGLPPTYTVTTPGATFERVRFDCLVNVQVANVTFRDCEIVGPATLSAQADKGLITAINANVANLLVERCLLRPRTPVRGLHGIIGHDYTLTRCNVTRVEDGAKNFNASGAADDLNIHGNWIHDLLYVCPDDRQSDNRTHCDCVQISGASGPKNISIAGNRIEAFIDPAVSTYSEPTYLNGVQQSGYQFFSDNGEGGPGGTWATSAVMLAPLGATLDNVVIDRNWIDGGAVSINFGSWTTATNLSVTGNRWGRNARRGPSYHIVAKPAQPITITGNTYEDDGTADNGRKNS